MQRDKILKEIIDKCKQEYGKIEDWPHDIDHVKRVVANGRKICKAEGLKSKDCFLVEVACWLHDLGRVGEKKGLVFDKSNHAEESYLISKKILHPYSRMIGRESMYKILQAVREHSDPVLRHRENIVSRILQDADRGAGINLLGIYGMMTNLGIVNFNKIKTYKESKERLPNLTEAIVNNGEIKTAISKLNYLFDWYYGTENQEGTRVRVSSLHTKSAKKIYLKDIEFVKKYIEELRELLK